MSSWCINIIQSQNKKILQLRCSLCDYEKTKKNENKKRIWKQKQKDRWLNRYGFDYAGRDAANTGVNPFNRIVPARMKKASWEVALVAKKRIRQFVQEENREVERDIPIII